ncbi:MAG: hypothetical protein ACI9TH_002205 [Kiritimatiellia bacterium]|jgi:purine-cytosine permease-like protein
MSERPSNEEPCWLDQASNVNRMIVVVIGICILLLIADLLFVSKVFDKHAHFNFENWVGFFPLMGFCSYCFIVLTAKALRRFLKRPEDYYDD